MELVLKVKKQDFEKVKTILLKDDTVSRASVKFRDSNSLGLKEGWYYFYVSGLEEACKKAKELTKELTKKIDKKEENDVIEKIKKEEETAISGFGSIFG